MLSYRGWQRMTTNRHCWWSHMTQTVSRIAALLMNCITWMAKAVGYTTWREMPNLSRQQRLITTGRTTKESCKNWTTQEKRWVVLLVHWLQCCRLFYTDLFYRWMTTKGGRRRRMRQEVQLASPPPEKKDLDSCFWKRWKQHCPPPHQCRK